jgi:hypothetical protein
MRRTFGSNHMLTHVKSCKRVVCVAFFFEIFMDWTMIVTGDSIDKL